MICQRSGKPVELCDECKAQQAAANAQRGVDQVTPPGNDVRGDITPGNAEQSDGSTTESL